jgi:hypothetical protein
MNKSLMIVICDFLLLSLLSLAKFDSTPPGQSASQIQFPRDSTNAPAELNDVLSVALTEERESREQLAQELAAMRQNLDAREAALAAQEARIRQAQQTLQNKEEEARRLAREQMALQQRYASVQTNLASLQQQLQQTSSSAQVSQAKFDVLQAELRKRQEEAERMRRQLEQADRIRQTTEQEKQQIAAQLRATEVEKRLAREQVQTLASEAQTARQEKAQVEKEAQQIRLDAERDKLQLAGELRATEAEKQLVREQVEVMRGEVQTVRQEKARLEQTTTVLAEGVTALAEKSGELTEEIRQNRPLAANNIFSEFVNNRVRSDFKAVRGGLFGRDVNREQETKTVLITDGKKTFAVFHIQDTPLSFSVPGTDWDWLTGNLRRKSAVVPIQQLLFLAMDPRIALVPVTVAQAAELGSKVYSISQEPFKFQEAVLVGGDEGYYGEARFQLDSELQNYVRMERSMFRSLFGKFSPSRGDLVFSKSGELLGVMVNNEYCAVLNTLATTRGLRLGPDIASQRTGTVLAEFRFWLDRLPFKLQ